MEKEYTSGEVLQGLCVGWALVLRPKLFRLVSEGLLFLVSGVILCRGLLKIIFIIGVMSSSQLLFGAQISVFSPTALPSIANKQPTYYYQKRKRKRNKPKYLNYFTKSKKGKITTPLFLLLLRFFFFLPSSSFFFFSNTINYIFIYIIDTNVIFSVIF